MAKNDLVVKLLLDSGAFGNDIRQAERRAKEFGDKIKSAGDTAGKFTNEIGLSAGAFGKLGGILTGAGGVIAAVGAFKSAMMSTHDSAMKFKGVIGGFDNVLETFQESLVNMDFTNLLEGLDEAYKRGKKYAELQMEVARAAVAYNLLDNRDRRDYKAIELKYKEAKTDSERAAAKKEAEELIASMRERVSSFTDIVNEEFIAGVIKGDPKIKEGSIDVKTALELLYQAAEHITSGYYKTDQSEYNRIKREIDHIDYVLEGGSVQLGTLHEREGEAQMFRWASDANEAAYQAAKKARENFERVWNNRDYYKQVKNNLIADNQGLFFRNELYKMGAEELQNIVNNLEQSFGKEMAIDELELNYKGWAPSSPTKPTGGSTTKTPKKDPDVRNLMSKNYLKEMIDAQKKMMDDFDVGTSDWWDAVDAIDAYQTELKEVEAYQNALLGVVDGNKNAAEGSMAYYDELIKEYEGLIEEKEALRYNTNMESEEWHKLTEEIKEYIKILDELKKKREKYESSTSTTPPKTKKSKNEELEEKRKAAVDAWNEREKYDRESDAWVEANERLKEYVEEYMRFVRTLNENDPIDKLQKKWANANMVVSSSVSVLNALSDTLANSEDESARKAGAWVDVFSTIGAGVQSYISIMQAAIATDQAYAMAKATGQAATLPFPANIAAIATVVATLTSVIAKINSIKNSAGKFAEGGIVGGTSFSGDKLFAMVNSGEMILNKRQQGNLANMLGGGGQVEFHISGDSLVGVLNNRQNKRNLTR